ncbi:hypothetical protein D1641_18205, partial [Colidextribacter sp. OB.20]|uniref:hypothetical protein n=1 Tax=Colidextribacter sp. OB.20 TaxID=2304568 RepID=UPI001368F42C
DTEGGDNPTQIVLVEYDADDNLDNITVGRLSDMKDGLITSEKNIQKDVNEQNVQMETVAVVVKAKSSNASEKDYTTARIVYIVVRPLWYNAVNDATGKWEKHYYERSLVSNNDDYSWTKLDLTNVDLTGGKTITSIEVYDENGKLITTVTGDYIRTVDDDVFANLPKEGAEIVIKTSAGSQVGEGNITVTNTAEAEITGITFNGDAVADVAALANKEAKIGNTIVMNIAGKVKVTATGANVTNVDAVYTFTVTGDTGVEITIEKDESADKAKLTLIGSLLTAPGIKVVEGTSTVLTGKTETTVVSGAIVEQVVYNVTHGKAVTIGSGAFGSSTNSYDVDGTMVTIHDANNSDSITFTMPKEDLTLNLSAADTFTDSENNTAGAKTAIYVADGVTGLKWTANDGTTAITPVSETGTGSNKGFTIYYVDTNTADKWSADVDTINVATANVKHGTIIAANASGGTAAATATPYIYPAVKVTLDQGAAASYDKSTTSTPADQSVSTGEGVVPGTMLKIGVANQTGVIVGETGDVGASVKTTGYTYEMPTTELKLVGGFKVTLNGGVKATIDSKSVTSGQVVTDLTNDLTAVAPTGMTVVKGTKSVSLAADKYADEAVAADITLNAAWELTLGSDKGIEILYRSQPSNKEQKPVTGTESTAIEKIYVVDDLTIEITGTDQLVVKDGSNADVDFTTYDKDGFNAETDYDAGAFWVKIKITENTKGWSIDGRQ